MKFFSYESKFSQLVLMLCQSCLLNVLWFICSIPIVTIGASTTALYYVCLKIVRGEEQYVIPMFFRSFKENFRQGMISSLAIMALGSFLVLTAIFSAICAHTRPGLPPFSGHCCSHS